MRRPKQVSGRGVGAGWAGHGGAQRGSAPAPKPTRLVVGVLLVFVLVGGWFWGFEVGCGGPVYGGWFWGFVVWLWCGVGVGCVGVGCVLGVFWQGRPLGALRQLTPGLRCSRFGLCAAPVYLCAGGGFFGARV